MTLRSTIVVEYALPDGGPGEDFYNDALPFYFDRCRLRADGALVVQHDADLNAASGEVVQEHISGVTAFTAFESDRCFTARFEKGWLVDITMGAVEDDPRHLYTALQDALALARRPGISLEDVERHLSKTLRFSPTPWEF